MADDDIEAILDADRPLPDRYANIEAPSDDEVVEGFGAPVVTASGQNQLSPEVQATLDAMKAGLEKQKRKLEKQKLKNKSLETDLQQARARVDEMENMNRRIQQEAEQRERQAQQKKKADVAAKRRLAARKRVLAADGDDGLDEMSEASSTEGDDTGDFYVFMRRLYKVFAKECLRPFDTWLRKYWPLRAHVEYIEARFGSSVSVYFQYSEMLFNLAIGNAVIWLTVQLWSILQQAAGEGPDVPQRISGPLAGLPPKQLFFSAYGGQPFGTWRSISIGYIVTLTAYTIWYLLLTLQRRSYEKHKTNYREVFDRTNKLMYARQLLTSWDVSSQSAEALQEAKHSALQNLRMLRAESMVLQRVRARSPEDQFALQLRRAFIVALHLMLQVAVWALIIAVQVNSTSIEQSVLSATNLPLLASLAVVVLYAALVELMPSAVPFLASACKWDRPRRERLHMLLGYYLARIIGLVVLGLSEFGMLAVWRDTRLGITDKTYPEWLYSIARQPNYADYECGQDQLNSKSLQQAVVGFLAPKVSELLEPFAKYIFATQLKDGHWTRDPFKVEKKFIRNVYFQGLLWIMIPFGPLMAFVTPLLLYVEFHFDKTLLLRLCTKATTPFQADLAHLLVYHTVTMYVFVVLWVFLFVSEPPTVALCGPFWNTSTGSGVGLDEKPDTVEWYLGWALEQWASDFVDFVRYYIIGNQFVLWLVIVRLSFSAYDQWRHIHVLEEWVEDRATVEIEAKAKLQARVVALQKKVREAQQLQMHALEEHE